LRNYAGELLAYPQVRRKKEKRQRVTPCLAAPLP
jgi:hypothetical protein